MLRIGKSKHIDLSCPNTQCAYLPFDTVVFSFECLEYEKIETLLHRYLKKYKLNGDWYQYSIVELINYIMDNYQIENYNYPSLNDISKKMIKNLDNKNSFCRFV